MNSLSRISSQMLDVFGKMGIYQRGEINCMKIYKRNVQKEKKKKKKGVVNGVERGRITHRNQFLDVWMSFYEFGSYKHNAPPPPPP